jgi:hypothetical protein
MHDVDRARSALHALDSGCPRDEWVAIAMAAKAAGLDFPDFHSWSEPAHNYRNEADCRAVWRSIDEAGGIGAGTLFAKAREAGWREPMNGHARPHQTAQEPRKAEPRPERPPFDFAAVWRDSEPATVAHPYVARKLGLADGLRVVPAASTLAVNRQSVAGWLAVPLYDDHELATLQFIGPHGDKLTAPGPMRGWFTVGAPIEQGATVYVCEGIGQAWSAHQATQSPAVVAFGLGRMKGTAQALAERGARVVMVADVGAESKIREAAKAIGCAWVAPPADLGKNGDVNDLHQRDGLQAVAELLERAVQVAPAEPVFAFVSLADLDTNPPPERAWVVHDWLPRSTLVAMFGGGGIGKSLLAQQISTCVGTGVQVFGQPVTLGPVLALFGEDDPDELRRRQRAILAHMGRSPGYSAGGLHFDGRAGRDSTLMTFGADRVPMISPLLEHLRSECARLRPVLVVLDNIAQMFGGIENDRHQVTVFANTLTGIAREFGCCVLLLGHVAKAVGSEYSGSTAWEAAVRTRLWLERREDGLIELHKAKANYAARGSVLLEYRHGALAQIDQDALDESDAVRAAEPVVLEVLATFTARAVATSHVPTARNNLLKLAAKEGLLKLPAPIATRALASLIDAGRVVPNVELPWRQPDRHKAFGLAISPEGVSNDA